MNYAKRGDCYFYYHSLTLWLFLLLLLTNAGGYRPYARSSLDVHSPEPNNLGQQFFGSITKTLKRNYTKRKVFRFDFTLVRWAKWINRNFSENRHNLKTLIRYVVLLNCHSMLSIEEIFCHFCALGDKVGPDWLKTSFGDAFFPSKIWSKILFFINQNFQIIGRWSPFIGHTVLLHIRLNWSPFTTIIHVLWW